MFLKRFQKLKKNYSYNCIIIFLIFFFIPLNFSYAAEKNLSQNIGANGLPLPRFVSIKASKANARVGPGQNYPIIWIYERKKIPVEIIREYNNWRQVRDSDNQGGWIYYSLLSSKRTVLISPWNKNKMEMVILRKTPEIHGKFLTFLEPGALALLNSCDGSWCEIEFPQVKGFIQQTQLWGVYPKEIVK